MLVLLLPLLAVGAVRGLRAGRLPASRPRRSRPTWPSSTRSRAWSGCSARAASCARCWPWPRSCVIVATMFVVAWTQLDQHRRARPAPTSGPALAGIGYIALRCVAARPARDPGAGLIDFVFQRWQHERDLRMTKQEVKEEHKNIEGDPHDQGAHPSGAARDGRAAHDGRGARRRPSWSPTRRTTPSRCATSARPDERTGAARRRQGRRPRRRSASRRSRASTASSATRTCRSRARCTRSCEIGDEIPDELFEAVAEVLAYVYRVQGQPGERLSAANGRLSDESAN